MQGWRASVRHGVSRKRRKSLKGKDAESLQGPCSKFGALFIALYVTIIFYSFLIVWITFLLWHIVMHVFEIFSVNDYHVYRVWAMCRHFLCQFQPHIYWSANKSLFWHICKQAPSVFNNALKPFTGFVYWNFGSLLEYQVHKWSLEISFSIIGFLKSKKTPAALTMVAL